MQTDSTLTAKNASTNIATIDQNDSNKSFTQAEITQLFNKVYDNNFLMIINELSTSIQSFHKSFVNQSNIIKSLFQQLENRQIDSLPKIKNEYNQVEIISSNFYSDAKILFKRMKMYRNSKIKGINQSSINIKHKKSMSINLNEERSGNPEKKRKISGLNDEIKCKIYKNDSKINSNESTQKENINNVNISNFELDNFHNSIKSQNDITDKEQNKFSHILNEFFNNLFKEIKYFEGNKNIQSIITDSDISNKTNIDKPININEFLSEKKSQIISSIKKIKEQLSLNIKVDSDGKSIMEDLSNEIKILKDENNKIKAKFDKYKSDEKIKKKFLENQIMNLSNKDTENEKNMKNKEKEFNEKKSKYENEISELKSDIIKANEKANEYIKANQELEIILKKMKEEKNEINKMNNNYEVLITENKIKEKAIEQIKNEVNELKHKNSELNDINISRNKELMSLKNKINEYEYEVNKNEKEIIEQKNKYKLIKDEMSEIDSLNNKYKETIIQLEKENNEINSLLIQSKTEAQNDKNKLNKKIEELQNEIELLNSDLDQNEKDIKNLNKKIRDKEKNIQDLENKYEKEVKKSCKLEKKIMEMESKEEEGNMTEYESKKRKLIPNKYIKTNNNNNNNNNSEIENVQKKFRFLYRTMENFHHNKSRNSSNANISRTSTEYNNNTNVVMNEINNNNNKAKTIYAFTQNDDINRGKSKLSRNYSNNNILNDKNVKNNNEFLDDKAENSSNTCCNIDISTDTNIKLTPENYSFIKFYQLNSKLKWCLFKKNTKKHSNIFSQNKSSYRRYSVGNEISTNLSNSDFDSSNFSDFIWLPYKTSKDFIEFGDLSSLNDYSDIKGEDDLSECKSIIKKLEIKLSEKEKEYNKLDSIFVKLIQENKSYKTSVDNLKKENLNLNNAISKYKSDLKNDKNFIGVSFIDDDPESSKFIDDKCCEELLSGLEKGKNKTKKTNYYSNNLKNCIDMLMTKVVPSENIRSLLASILRQLGCSDEDIYKLIGNYRGVISIPFSYNKFCNK